MSEGTTRVAEYVVGLDVSDRKADYYVVEKKIGCPKVSSGCVSLTEEALRKEFGAMPPMTAVLEAGTHSGWLTDLLEELGHTVIVANARSVPLIYASRKKNDQLDAQRLAELGCLNPRLLSPIKPRSRQTRQDLAVVRARDTLVRKRSSLVVHIRGLVKPFGERITSGGTGAFPRRVRESLSPQVLDLVEPILAALKGLTEAIQQYDAKIKGLIKRRPEALLLQQVTGVGPLTAITFLLIIGDPYRFQKCRAVGNYLGLTPRQADSGDYRPQLRITKHGDELLRRYLVQAAHYILGAHGPDTDLRRWGQAIYERGGPTAKKRAIVAVARKLSVLLCRLWKTGEVYTPLSNNEAA